VLAYGKLFIQTDDNGDLILVFQTDRGTVIPGGKVDGNGDLTDASQELFRSFFRAWGMTGITLTAESSSR
jgi:hypothetical protein